MDLDEEVEAPPKGITTALYIKFINELFDVMDRDETMKEYYWVMDNVQYKNHFLCNERSKFVDINIYIYHPILQN